MVVSSSPQDVVLPIAHHLGADIVIASQLDVDDNGRYTGQLRFFAYGDHKVRAMQELSVSHGLDLKRSWAYSDSITDLPMLEAVGHPVTVNPDDDLQAVALTRGWNIESFTEPGTLEPVPSTRKPTAFVPSAELLIACRQTY